MSDADAPRRSATAEDLGIAGDLARIEELCETVADALSDLDCAEAAVDATLAARVVEGLQRGRRMLGSFRRGLVDADEHLQAADGAIPLCPSALRDVRQLIQGVLEEREGAPVVRRERVGQCARHLEIVIGDCPHCTGGQDE
ncbi:hypothetical protein [Halostella pelagica]|uniref:hypothetical protein n=1 Tax=Halostella pelagica TaxID=2583824 RepID=UPI001080B6F5|nr:hypothetical protein [Halostella pelagica]